jgi:hypothetical protein
MKNRIKKIIALQNPFVENSRKAYDFEQVLQHISDVRGHSDFLALYARPTGIHWKGIANATENLFPQKSVAIPQHYSEQVISDKELLTIAKRISNLGFKEVCFSGCPLYFFKLIPHLHLQVKCSVVFMGTLSEITGVNATSDLVKNILFYYQRGEILKIGFLKSGLTEVFKKIYRVNALELVVPPPAEDLVKTIAPVETDKTKTNIGVLAEGNFNKNVFNQVAASLLIPSSVVHVLNFKTENLIRDPTRIINHANHLNHSDFLRLLAATKINLYVSFSESWGQVVTESMALGIPCLAAASSSVLAQYPPLAKFLGVAETDNPNAIANQIKFVMENYNETVSLCQTATLRIREAHAESVNLFLSN